jgi:hypothetical protein
VIAKGKETKDMKEECADASRLEGSGSDKCTRAQIVRRTSRLSPANLGDMGVVFGFGCCKLTLDRYERCSGYAGDG